MKFNKAIICLIVCFLVLNAVEARKGKSQLTKKSGKGFFDRIMSDWNSVSVEVVGTSNYKFSCKIKDVELDGKALGVAFDGFEQISSKDQSGFIQYIQRLYKVDGQDFQKPVLDYRFIQGCVVMDNANESFGDWRLEMNLKANEEYNQLPSANQNKGQSWRMKITMPAANKGQATSFKSSLMKNCQHRNKVMNDLKDAAIAAGNNYNSLYYGFKNREQSLQDMALMTDNAEKVVDDVKAEQEKESALIQASVEANQQLLDQTLAEIQKTAEMKQSTEQETEALSVQLQIIQANLVKLQGQQSAARKVISESQRQLAQVQALKNKLTSDKKDLNTEKAKTTAEQTAQTAKAAAEQKEFARVMAEIKKKQEAAKAAAAEAKAAKEAEIAEIAKQISSTDASISEQAKKIAELLRKMAANQAVVDSIDSQIGPIDAQIKNLIQQINDKRSTAQQMAAALKTAQAEKAATEAELNTIKENGDKELANLGKRLQAQLALVKKLDAEEKKKQQYFLEQAEKDIVKANGDFAASLKAIVAQSQITSLETRLAQQTVLEGKHVQHIAAVVSVNKDLMKMSLLRLAKYNRQMTRLARARLSQMSSVRQQQKKLKNKLRRSHKHLSA